MRIAIITDSLSVGGAEWQATLSAAELTRRGHDVDLIAFYPGNAYADFTHRWGVRLVRLPVGGRLRLSRINALVRHVRSRRFDVVHIFKATSFSTRLAVRAVSWRVFAGYRGMTPLNPPLRALNLLLGRGTLGWITNSQAVRRFVVRRLGVSPRKAFVVPNGILPERVQTPLTPDEARAAFGLEGSAVVVAMVANLRAVKNHRMLLRVAKHLAGQTSIGWRFVIAGEGPLRASLQQAARDYGIAQQVTFLGRCDDVPGLLRATDICALTSKTEGLPNTLLEAGLSGVPCVSTNNGGAAEVILDGQTGYLVPVDDDAAMAGRLVTLAKNPRKRRRMGDAARRFVAEHFSMQAMGDRLLAAYQAGLSLASARS